MSGIHLCVGPEIFEIRRISGLTWDELSFVLGVSRRSLHHWANGKRVSAANDVLVRRMLATLRRIDSGDALKNRMLLTSPGPGGGLMMDLLRRRDFDAVDRAVPAGTGRPPPGGRLSTDAESARRPPSPADLINARHDNWQGR